MVATKAFYGVDVGADADSTPVSTAEVREIFEILKPKVAKTPLIRIGGDLDGAYLVPDDIDGIAACFSPGVNRIKYFEDFLTDHYGIAAHMCDFTCSVDEFKTPLRAGMQTFQKKWLEVAEGEDNIALDDWVRDSDETGDLMLQMDIEGAEFRNILGTSDETLSRFRVIVLEVHGLGKMLDGPVLRGVIAPFFQKLGRSFTSVHAHPNNCCGEFAVPGTDIRIPNLLEITFVRNDRFVAGEGVPLLPHPLDVGRNVPRNAPLFLSDAWCDGARPLESRVKMLEDTVAFEQSATATSADSELAGALAMTMQGAQTSLELLAREAKRGRQLTEVAHGRPYRLSSAYGNSQPNGIVGPRGDYFFHTEFGRNQSIRVDLGRAVRVQRIEVTNRRNGHRDRARFLFAQLTVTEKGRPLVFPMAKDGQVTGDGWAECGIDLPAVKARFVTITTPMNTALHLADVRVYAVDETADAGRHAPAASGARRFVGRARRRARRVGRQASQRLRAGGGTPWR